MDTPTELARLNALIVQLLRHLDADRHASLGSALAALNEHLFATNAMLGQLLAAERRGHHHHAGQPSLLGREEPTEPTQEPLDAEAERARRHLEELDGLRAPLPDPERAGCERYVLGFVFDTSGTRLMLLRKARPAWQCGRLNGCGGHVRPGENAAQAMERECREETGAHVPAQAWMHVGTLRSRAWYVDVFAVFSDDAYAQCATPAGSDQPVTMLSLLTLAADRHALVSHAATLVWAALQRHTRGAMPCTVHIVEGVA